MWQYIKKTTLILAVFTLAGAIFILSNPIVQAQSPLGSRGEDETVDYSDNDEDEADDENDIDVPEELPNPVLFGDFVDEIYPSFGDPRGGGSRSHEGLDIMAPAGTPVVSPTEAEVLRIGTWRGAGKFVITERGDERFYYFHLEDQADYLNEGDDVEAGELIGFVGSSGNAIASAPHLHLEIHEDREVIDPYPRITHDYTLEEKMEIMEQVFDVADDEDELAELLVDEFSSVFGQATRAGYEIPEEILAELPDNFTSLSALSQRNLTIGSEGSGVRTLQQILIDTGHLTRVSAPTGYFGPITKTALADYQAAVGIEPASGYYGPITRAQLQDSRIVVTEANSEVASLSQDELEEKIQQLKEQIKVLQAELAS